MKHLVLHPRTVADAAHFVSQPSHALLLIGDAGIGKMALAQAIAGTILGLDSSDPEPLNKHPYVKTVSPSKIIPIDSIRELGQFLQLKTLGSRPIRRVIILDQAHTLTIEAQNAFLKILEEPPADTMIIATASSKRSLLPTILSRVQIITLHKPSDAAVQQFFAQRFPEQSVKSAYLLSGGLPGLMQALLEQDKAHPLAAGVTDAKKILQSSLFDRLVAADGLSKNKDDAASMLEALQHIAQTGLDQAAAKGDTTKVRQWHHILTISTEAHENLSHSVNTKLLLTNLMLQL